MENHEPSPKLLQAVSDLDDVRLLRTMLEEGLDLTEEYPLIYGVRRENLTAVEILLRFDVDIDQRDSVSSFLIFSSLLLIFTFPLLEQWSNQSNVRMQYTKITTHGEIIN